MAGKADRKRLLADLCLQPFNLFPLQWALFIFSASS